MKTVLGIFCKQPVPGHVKTRLASEIGDEPAARLYEAFLTDVVERLGTAGDHRILCYASDHHTSPDYFRRFAATRYQIHPQVDGNLGNRLKVFFASEFLQGADRVIVIGSDCPTIAPGVIQQAATELDRSDAVLGRSDDGGYYLIGLRRMSDDLFTGIDWSTSAVYDQQTRRLTNAGLTISTLPPIPEVDTPADLERLRDHPLLAECPNTNRVLSEIPRR